MWYLHLHAIDLYCGHEQMKVLCLSHTSSPAAYSIVQRRTTGVSSRHQVLRSVRLMLHMYHYLITQTEFDINEVITSPLWYGHPILCQFQHTFQRPNVNEDIRVLLAFFKSQYM